jgi:undecaprenyl-diphosphatase
MIQLAIQQFSSWDAAICLRIYGWNGRAILDRIMKYSSWIGEGYVYPVVGLIVLFLDFPAASAFFKVMAVGFAMELIIQKILKHGLKRMRPCFSIPGIRNLVALPDVFSFPSGHTAGAFLMAFLIGSGYPPLAVPVFSLAALIGFSRIYNGVHYPSDVLAGAVLGLACAKIGLILI